MPCFAHALYLGLLCVRIGQFWLPEPDPSEPVGHASTDSPLGSWHVGILLSSRQELGKPEQQMYSPHCVTMSRVEATRDRTSSVAAS